VRKSFGEKVVLSKLDFMVERGDKIAFVGRNGEGKTTLSKIITGKLEHEGAISLGHNVQLGYFAQNQADTLDPSLTVMETLEQVAGGTTTQQIRNILGAFLFGGEAVDKRVKVLSGGEKGRLAIARLLMQPVNLLVLDEPTNHLDMRSKDILKESLKQYDGTLILVSHDREFLDGLCNKVFEFKNGSVREFPGGIFDFLQSRKLETLKQLEQNKQASKKPDAPVIEQKKQVNPEIEKQKKQLQTKIRNSEERIAQLESELEVVEAALADPETYADAKKSSDLLARHVTMKNELETAMQSWEAQVLQLESL
jgi:ATP-binding cassette subfamily F protein 3